GWGTTCPRRTWEQYAFDNPVPAISLASVTSRSPGRTSWRNTSGSAGSGCSRSQAAASAIRFLLTCYPDPTYRPDNDQPFRLVAPYERDPKKWIRLDWYEVNTGQRYRITTHGTGSGGAIRVGRIGRSLPTTE